VVAFDVVDALPTIYNMFPAIGLENGIKQVIIEIVASKAGLLKTEILTDGGPVDTVRTLSESQIKNMLKTYVTRDA